MATPPSLPAGYTLRVGSPSAAEYLHLRTASGLTPTTPEQAAAAVKGGWYGCYVAFDGAAVGMGRIVSDGAWYFHVVDMAVLPEHQRRGLGGAVLAHLMAHIAAHAAPGEPYINLFADPPGRKLYRRHGFVDSLDQAELGMVWKPRAGEALEPSA